MKDPRLERLADVLVGYSCKVKPGDKVLVEYRGRDTMDLAAVCCQKITEAGGVPIWFYNGDEFNRSFAKYAEEEQFISYGQVHLSLMKQVDCYIGIRGDANPYDLSDITRERTELNAKHVWQTVHIGERLKKRWVVLRYPTATMSLQAEMPTEAFEDFYFRVCTLDYSRLAEAMAPLKTLMEQTDQVMIKGPGTELTFSIKGMNAIPCAGECNIPDGEIFTAPIKDSVNGVIQYNTPTVYGGKRFENVRLRFEEGKIVEASAGAQTDALNQILDTDEGARYIGEFAIAVNPYINTPMMDILFDEKINGSFHLTPGNAYDEADNGNKSAVHWDLVCIQREDYGGGEIYFDGELIRKDGVFVHPDLKEVLSLAHLTGD